MQRPLSPVLTPPTNQPPFTNPVCSEKAPGIGIFDVFCVLLWGWYVAKDMGYAK